MTTHFHRRHSRWYEVILFSTLFQVGMGTLFICLGPAILVWGMNNIFINPSITVVNSISAVFFAFISSFFISKKFQAVPGNNHVAYSISTALGCWGILITYFIMAREESYSRPVIAISLVFQCLWILLTAYLNRKLNRKKFAVVPFGRASTLKSDYRANFTMLSSPNLGNRRFDGVIADLHTPELNAEWQRFLAQCTLARIPVYHTQHIIEALTGRVQIDHLSENQFGSLLPSSIYSFFKRILDLSLVIITAPVWLPVMLITGVVIKLESEGPMFFKQERVGQADKTFTVYKLRSMCKDSEKDGAQFAQANDARITRVGHFIRKTRLDEIPQFINVLKGDMSLIGPRPEQRVFVDEFEKTIPFYAYRHVVKPGITGWAQVVHGYAADAEDTQVKIEHDFYYIKNFSIWLDMLIIAKTVKTILTGFGAR